MNLKAKETWGKILRVLGDDFTVELYDVEDTENKKAVNIRVGVKLMKK